MNHLHQLKIKLLNILATYYTLAEADKAKVADEEIESVINEIFGAMGGCDKCWGRGYLVNGQEAQYCICLRAERLKQFLKMQNG